jgi:hypothetical protein
MSARAKRRSSMWLHERLEVDGPDLEWGWRTISAGLGSDEYGNCSLYLRTALFGIVIFPFPRFQRKAEVPEPGTHPWIDAVQYPDLKPAEPGWVTAGRERCELTSHLHDHPDHAGHFPAGHDFTLVSTADIRRRHERLHEERTTGHGH